MFCRRFRLLCVGLPIRQSRFGDASGALAGQELRGFPGIPSPWPAPRHGATAARLEMLATVNLRIGPPRPYSTRLCPANIQIQIDTSVRFCIESLNEHTNTKPFRVV